MDRFVKVTMAACGTFYAFFIWRTSFVYEGTRYFTLFDDAMISMTYARNLADGNGLVWNVGAPAVEGFTNPLWTIVMAACHRLGLPESSVALAVSLLSAALLLGCIAMAAAVARRLCPQSVIAPRTAAALVGIYYPLVYWSLRGMEVGLVTFVILAAVLIALRLYDAASSGSVAVRDVVLLCVVVAVGVSTRVDFVVPAAVLTAWLLFCLDRRARWIVTAPLVVTGVVAVGGQVLGRLAYYGEPLPNTYYLKVAGQPVGPRWWRGFTTLLALVLADALVVIGVTVAGLRARRRRRNGGSSGPERDDKPLVLLLSMAAALCAYSVFVGGDAWEWARLANRYVTPAVVLALIVASTLLEPLAARIRRMKRPLFGLALVVVPAVVLTLSDAFVAVLLRDQLNLDVGASPTTTRDAVVTVVVLIVALAAVFVVGARPLPPKLARGSALPVVLAVAVGLSATGSAWLMWKDSGGFFVEENRGATAYGVELERLTEPGASIAVVWAGAPIYFAHRNGVDLLGKMDPVIAHGPHHEGIGQYPGHDKFDFDRSIGELRPDVIAQYAWFRDEDVDRFVKDGYRPMRFRDGIAPELSRLAVPRALLWVRDDSDLVHRDALVPVSIEDAKRQVVERT